MKKKYGPLFWTPPDAGNADHSTYVRDKTFALSTLGGGNANNDGRYVNGPNAADAKETPGWGRSILEYIEQVGKKEKSERKPFCLFISLVNPHDVWVYPIGWDEAGYEFDAFADMGIDLPPNFHDTLKTKPSIQLKARDAINKIAPFKDPKEYVNYANFYAYLHTLVDQQIMTILDKLELYNLLDDTVIIRSSDHGELGMSHGMREKAYTAYEEEIHIPLIISNPKLFPAPKSTNAFYSHVDLIPTIADLMGIGIEGADFQGISQYPVILGKSDAVRESVLFTYDDVYLLPADTPSSHIRCIREGKWTYAVYFSLDGKDFEYELYDLEKDPGELVNLLYGEKTQVYIDRAALLHRKLTEQIKQEKALPKEVPWPEQPWST